MNKKTKQSVASENEALRKHIEKHNHLYYKENRQEITDQEFDALFRKLKMLESQNPNLRSKTSPTEKIGSDLANDFKKVTHTIPVLSLENTYNTSELMEWASKIGLNEEFSVEWKIDGASILLYYIDGILETCATRGSGGAGDDVTANVKTIASIPLSLKKNLSLSVRGEVFMNFSDFEEFNESYGGKFANPRNLAAGSLKHKFSSEVAKRPLSIFVYDAILTKGRDGIKTHSEILAKLKSEGFPLAPDSKIVAGKDLEKTIESFKKKKDQMGFPIDGLVIKLNSLQLRESLGETSHSPRWARAFKFEALMKETVIEDITVATGRTGKITPRARIQPINISGTTVTFATLHNQDYIDELGAGIGATVLVSKRGEIIPAVERVLNPPPKSNGVFKLPNKCPSCKNPLKKISDSVDLFCTNSDCQERMKHGIEFFCSKKQMNIEGLGEKQIELFYSKGWLKSLPDIYDLPSKAEEIKALEGFGEKSLNLLVSGIEKSKERDFKFLLPSLGLNEVGHKVTEILIENGYDSWEKLTDLVKGTDPEKELEQIHGIGPRTIESLVSQLKDESIQDMVRKLKSKGLHLAAKQKVKRDKQPFKDQVWCVTGSFEKFQPREKAMEIVTEYGGKKVSSVSSKITHLLYGPGAGSKLQKAEELGKVTIDEATFLKMLAEHGINPFE